jgi:hypothetical protein
MLTGTHRCCALLALLLATALLSAGEPDEYSDPFLDSPLESNVVPAAADDGAFVDSPVRTADVGGEPAYGTAAGPDSLFPNGPPAAEPELSYPDGAVPIQYPLDDRATAASGRISRRPAADTRRTAERRGAVDLCRARLSAGSRSKHRSPRFSATAIRWGSHRSTCAGRSNSAVFLACS